MVDRYYKETSCEHGKFVKHRTGENWHDGSFHGVEYCPGGVRVELHSAQPDYMAAAIAHINYPERPDAIHRVVSAAVSGLLLLAEQTAD